MGRPGRGPRYRWRALFSRREAGGDRRPARGILLCRAQESRSRPNGCRIRSMSDVATIDEVAIMAVLETVPDPEIPVLSITDLGIVRGFAVNPPRVRVSPTYTGCPATVAIEMLIREALDKAGFNDVHIERVLLPPWTTACITESGRQPLHVYG